MSMLRFSAEASLYKARGHYRTGRQALYLPRRTNSLRLAFDESEVPIDVPGETIPVHGCPPGWKEVLPGVCVRQEWEGGGGPSPGTPDEPSGEGPHGPGGEPPRPEPASNVGKAWATQCSEEEDAVSCCYDKITSCRNQFPRQGKLCNSYGEVCLSKVRDPGKAWAEQCKQHEVPLQCCNDKGKSCAQQFPRKKKLCDHYASRCLIMVG
jgi:hypothetical protein